MEKMADFHFHVMLMQGVRLLRKPIDRHPRGANIHLWMSSNDDEFFLHLFGKELIRILLLAHTRFLKNILKDRFLKKILITITTFEQKAQPIQEEKSNFVCNVCYLKL